MSNRSRLPWLAAAALAVALVYAYFRFLWPHPEGLSQTVGGVVVQLLHPRRLAWLLVVPFLLVVLSRSLAGLPWQQRALSWLFRSAFVVLLSLCVGQLVRRAFSDRVCTVFLVDVSDSVTDEALAQSRATVQRAIAGKRAADRAIVVRFGRRPERLKLTEQGELPPLRSSAGGFGSETDLQAALQLAYGAFPPGYLRRVVLLSDGAQTRGDLLSEAPRAARFGVQISTAPYPFAPPAEVAVVDLSVPAGVKVGQPFFVSATLRATQTGPARVRLFQGEMLNGLDSVRTLELAPGDNAVKFRSVVRVGGPISYRLEVDRLEQDHFAENNRFVRSVDVPGRPTVLYVDGQPARASYLASALGAQQFDVDLRGPTALPRSLPELSRYDFFILSDIAADKVDAGVQSLVEQYLKEVGGGFLFAGGTAGYSLGGWGGTTIERLLPVRMDGEHRRDMPGVALSLVIDRSGSMTDLPIEMAKAACRATVETLRGDDLVEVIAFDSQPRRFVKMQPARYRNRIQSEIATIQPGGGTAIFGALDAAYQDISVVQARKKHVILLTDGRAESDGIVDLVGAMIAERITVTTVGLGDSADADLLRLIAEAGGGRYHHVPDPNALPRIFTRETEMISRQAAVQEWFPVRQTAPADFLRGIDLASAPLLHGYVATQLKQPPAQQILQSDQGEPILARWRVGLGWALAWTSDVKNNWAVDWLRWGNFGRFWGQLIREHMRANRRRELDMVVTRRGDKIVASVDAFTPDGQFESGLRSQLRLQGPLPSEDERPIAMHAVAPGRYEASFELDQYGSFLLSATHSRVDESGQEQIVAVSSGQVAEPYPGEYSHLEPNRRLLSRVASVTGGVADAAPQAYFAARGEKTPFDEPLWPKLVLVAIACALLDLLLRRVRLFDRDFRR